MDIAHHKMLFFDKMHARASSMIYDVRDFAMLTKSRHLALAV